MLTSNQFTSNLEEKIQLYNKLKFMQNQENSKTQTINGRNRSPSFSLLENKTISPIEQFSTFSRNNNYIDLPKNNTINTFTKNGISSISNTKTLHRTRSVYLYENSKLILSKLESKRNKINAGLKKNRTPEITIKAKSIKRDPNLFCERLYPGSTKKITIDTNDLYGTDSKFYNRPKKIIKDEQFEFKPKIDKLSQKIASKLENTTIRLNKPRQRSKAQLNSTMTLEIEMVEKKYKKLTLPNYEKNIRHKNKTPSLYLRGMEMIKRKNEIMEENKKENERHYLQFSFKPNISPSSIYKNKICHTIKIHQRARSTEENGKKQNFDELYKRNERWKQAIEAKNKKIQNEKKNKELRCCTFVPKINKKVMENDTRFIQNNLEQIVTYVKKRQDFLKLKEEDELYKNKIFYNQYIPHSIKKKHLRNFSHNNKTNPKNKSLCIEEEFDCKNFSKKK